MNNLLLEVKRLKDYAKVSKDFKDFEDAIKDLEKSN